MFSSSEQKQQTNHKQNGNLVPNMAKEDDERETSREALKEGPVARALEKRTAQLPSDLFLWGATASIALSLGMQLTGRKQLANFVGHWAPTFLALGLYNKLVKVAGHDRATE